MQQVDIRSESTLNLNLTYAMALSLS